MDELGSGSRLVEHLIALGYPRDSLVQQPTYRAGDNVLSPDLLVVDPRRRVPLAVFETKKIDAGMGEAVGRAILETYAAAHDLPSSVPLFFVAERASVEPLEFLRLKGDDIEPVRDLPTFKALKALSRSSAKQAVQTKQEDTTRRFLWVSWSLGVLAILLFAADVVVQARWSWQLLTAERLTVVGVGAALFVLPFVAKLKFLGLEYEALQSERTQSDG